MKIKTKKEMNLPQFIAWAVDNHITGSFYANNRVNAKRIRFEFGRIVSSHGELRSHDTFTVEVEEMSKSEIEHYKQQADEYFKLWQEQEEKYNKLTEHIRLKALHNPSISRYKDLMCFINEMEGK